MSIEDLCIGSILVRQTMSHAIGASGGDVSVSTDGDSLECCVQEMDSSEAVRYDARGERSLFTAMFAENPGFTIDDRAKLTQRDGATVDPPTLMRVIGAMQEGSPDGELSLWIVDLEDVTTRFEE